MSDEEKQGRLSRWAARKRAVQQGDLEGDAHEAGALDENAQKKQEIEGAQEAKVAQEAEHEANRLAAEAVDLENITEETDFKIFLREGVPTLLRKKALALLWRSNPILANIDGLNDYDENFADPSLIMKNFDSAYQVGKGYLKKIVENFDETSDELIEELNDAPDAPDAPKNEILPNQDEELQDVESAREPDDFAEPLAEGERAEDEGAEEEGFDESPAEPKLSLRQRRQLMGG